jgi:hypothetical protein
VRDSFDRRVVSEQALTFIRECQARVACRLAGGAALSGVWLVHRLSADIDLFCSSREDTRDLVRAVPDVAARLGMKIEIQVDSGSHVRGRLAMKDSNLELDLVHDALPCIQAPVKVESILVESAVDLRAAKLTCLLSRSEPRDLVDILFLERAGFVPENDLPFALRKDAGIDPGTLAWLLRDFPVRPLPTMLQSLTVEELSIYRDKLVERLRRLNVP